MVLRSTGTAAARRLTGRPSPPRACPPARDGSPVQSTRAGLDHPHRPSRVGPVDRLARDRERRRARHPHRATPRARLAAAVEPAGAGTCRDRPDERGRLPAAAGPLGSPRHRGAVPPRRAVDRRRPRRGPALPDRIDRPGRRAAGCCPPAPRRGRGARRRGGRLERDGAHCQPGRPLGASPPGTARPARVRAARRQVDQGARRDRPPPRRDGPSDQAAARRGDLDHARRSRARRRAARRLAAGHRHAGTPAGNRLPAARARLLARCMAVRQHRAHAGRLAARARPACDVLLGRGRDACRGGDRAARRRDLSRLLTRRTGAGRAAGRRHRRRRRGDARRAASRLRRRRPRRGARRRPGEAAQGRRCGRTGASPAGQADRARRDRDGPPRRARRPGRAARRRPLHRPGAADGPLRRGLRAVERRALACARRGVARRADRPRGRRDGGRAGQARPADAPRRARPGGSPATSRPRGRARLGHARSRRERGEPGRSGALAGAGALCRRARPTGDAGAPAARGDRAARCVVVGSAQLVRPRPARRGRWRRGRGAGDGRTARRARDRAAGRPHGDRRRRAAARAAQRARADRGRGVERGCHGVPLRRGVVASRARRRADERRHPRALARPRAAGRAPVARLPRRGPRAPVRQGPCRMRGELRARRRPGTGRRAVRLPPPGAPRAARCWRRPCSCAASSPTLWSPPCARPATSPRSRKPTAPSASAGRRHDAASHCPAGETPRRRASMLSTRPPAGAPTAAGAPAAREPIRVRSSPACAATSARDDTAPRQATTTTRATAVARP